MNPIRTLFGTRPASDTRAVRLRSVSDLGPSVQIQNPEQLSATDHAAFPLPHDSAPAYLQQIDHDVDRLAGAGGLDQDTLDALFHTIACWRRTWGQQVAIDAAARGKTEAMIVAQLQQNLTDVAGQLAVEQRRLAWFSSAEDAGLGDLGLDVGVDRHPGESARTHVPVLAEHLRGSRRLGVPDVRPSTVSAAATDRKA